MSVYFNIAAFQFVDKDSCCRLTAVTGDNNAVYFKTIFAEIINETKNVHVISDAKVTADLISFDITGVYTDDNFGFVL